MTITRELLIHNLMSRNTELKRKSAIYDILLYHTKAILSTLTLMDNVRYRNLKSKRKISYHKKVVNIYQKVLDNKPD